VAGTRPFSNGARDRCGVLLESRCAPSSAGRCGRADRRVDREHGGCGSPARARRCGCASAGGAGRRFATRRLEVQRAAALVATGFALAKTAPATATLALAGDRYGAKGRARALAALARCRRHARVRRCRGMDRSRTCRLAESAVPHQRTALR
jgi:hypothetical protein